MTDVLIFIVPVIIAYLIGSISFGFVIGRMAKGIDIRNHGSGNAGATNTYRVMGKQLAIMVLLLDVAKAVLAIWIAKWMAVDQIWVAICAGIAVISGHNWPVFFGFRGGKGVASTIGVMAMLCFFPTLIAGMIAILTITITRYVSLGSLLLTGTLPIWIWLMDVPHRLELTYASIMIAALAFYQHRSNIGKLIKGNENKIFKKTV
jgi:glycerol-3-phosphate acyltransferase PlsY